jgi:hypothetical protein
MCFAQDQADAKNRVERSSSAGENTIEQHPLIAFARNLRD